MENKLYIKKFVRDDGEQLEFDGYEIYLAAKNSILEKTNPTTTALNYTEADGGEMIHQQNGIYEQPLKGLLVPKTNSYWSLVKQLSTFFEINHTYKIIYIKKDGNMFSVSNAWIQEGFQINPVANEDYSNWSITFAIGDTNWREYAENGQGEEIYSNDVDITKATASSGGELWDSIGEVWDSIGGEWEIGSGGAQTIIIDSIKKIYPVWKVIGPCLNPSITNNTTDTSASYDGMVDAGQTLIVDFATGVAYLDTALATRDVFGLVSFIPGENIVEFDSDGGTTDTTTISWNNIIG